MAFAACSMAPRAARTAATAENCPSIMASSASLASHASISEYRGLGRSVLMDFCPLTRSTRMAETRSHALAPFGAGDRGFKMTGDMLFLGVDGGGTRCRARLCDAAGNRLGEALSGPANIGYGLDEAFVSVFDAIFRCLAQAHLSPNHIPRIVACLALAG